MKIESKIYNLRSLKKSYKKNFLPFVIIDNFLQKKIAENVLVEISNFDKQFLNTSRDYIFAKNKFEKSRITDLGIYSQKLNDYLISSSFQNFLRDLTGIKNLLVDDTFHGGGLHLGGKHSFLDLHTDFTYHPIKKYIKRELNILIYLNRNWKKDYGGQLILKHKKTGQSVKIAPLFNRCVIMQTSDLSLHGYEPINFPDGLYRTSIAAYAYYPVNNQELNKSTQWFPEKTSILKKIIGRLWPSLVRIKGIFFGSSTSKNK